jgi:hypothetical protein
MIKPTKHRRVYQAILVLLVLASGSSGLLVSSYNLPFSVIIIPAFAAGIAMCLLLMKINGWNPLPYQPPK